MLRRAARSASRTCGEDAPDDGSSRSARTSAPPLRSASAWVGAKLYTFGLGAAIAAVGGVLIGFRRPSVVFYPTFSVFQSILVVLYAVIGGIGFVAGALIGAALAPSTLIPYTFGDLFKSEAGRAAHARDSRVRRAARRAERPREPGHEGGETGDEGRRGTRGGRSGRPSAPKTLEAEGVRVRFGVVDTLDGVSITVRPNQVLGLIGPNGAGKSTLIDTLTGFAKPTAGRVLLDGEDVTDVVRPQAPSRESVARSRTSSCSTA